VLDDVQLAKRADALVNLAKWPFGQLGEQALKFAGIHGDDHQCDFHHNRS
jgi:hypothetical protein